VLALWGAKIWGLKEYFITRLFFWFGFYFTKSFIPLFNSLSSLIFQGTGWGFLRLPATANQQNSDN